MRITDEEVINPKIGTNDLPELSNNDPCPFAE